jgi:hypothetical protein
MWKMCGRFVFLLTKNRADAMKIIRSTYYFLQEYFFLIFVVRSHRSVKK